MCVTRHSRQPPSVWVDVFVNTSAIYGALHFIWHFVLQRCTPLQPHLLFMKSHLHSHYNKCQQSKEPTCFSMSVITRDVSWCCVENCPFLSLSLCFLPLCFAVQQLHRIHQGAAAQPVAGDFWHERQRGYHQRSVWDATTVWQHPAYTGKHTWTWKQRRRVTTYIYKYCI